MEEEFYRELIGKIIDSEMNDVNKVDKIRREMCRKHSSSEFPSYIQILMHASKKEYDKLKFLQTKPIRTISGVAPLAIMTKPIQCPHGKCTFCPGGLNSYFGDMPQSYTGNEPATMRAARNGYDPYLQVFNRLEQYQLLNHNLDKIEMIIMGGTFPSFDVKYQEEFVKHALKAMNDFGEMFYKEGFDLLKFKEFFELPCDVKDQPREENIKGKVLKLKGECSLEKEQLRNETSYVRCVAMALETRPDYCKGKEIDMMLNLGCTRVELGVQSIYDSVLKRSERGHTVKDAVEATQMMKDSFLKIGYHIMPGLDSSDKEKDVQMFKEIFSNPDYMPDFLKIYPCMVMPGTKLNEKYSQGKFKPLTTKEAASLIAEGKLYIPKFCRVQRIQRDIPTKVVAAGVDVTNLRQHVDGEMRIKKIKCRCIRCHEPKDKPVGEVRMHRLDYEASNGQEVFLSMEDKNNTLIGFCRMRKPYMPFRKEITSGTVGIRELHVYSPSLTIGTKDDSSFQHRGYGKQLMLEAERIATEDFDAKKIAVISGIGVKEYFRKKLNYKKDGIYMSKTF